MLGLMDEMRPGKFGGTEARMVTTARQFYIRGPCQIGLEAPFASAEVTHEAASIPVPTMWTVHRRHVNLALVHDPVLSTHISIEPTWHGEVN